MSNPPPSTEQALRELVQEANKFVIYYALVHPHPLRTAIIAAEAALAATCPDCHGTGIEDCGDGVVLRCMCGRTPPKL